MILLLLFLFQCYATDKDYSSATNKALQAFYAQTGMDVYVNTTAKDLNDRLAPEFLNNEGIWALLLLKACTQKKIEWKVTFP